MHKKTQFCREACEDQLVMHYRDDDNGLLRLNPASNNHLIVHCEMNNFLPHTFKDSFLQLCLFYFSLVYFLIHNASRWHSTVHMRPIEQRGLFITKVFSVVPIMVLLWGKTKRQVIVAAGNIFTLSFYLPIKYICKT